MTNCRSLALFASLLLASPVFSAAPADTTSIESIRNDRIGVAVHFSHRTRWMAASWDAEKYMPMIAGLGVGWIRDNIAWADVEPERGRYRISENTRKWVELAHAHDLKIIANFNARNPSYEDQWDAAAYAKAAAWLAKELDGKIHAIEILNEPFGMGFARDHNNGKPHAWTGREPDGSDSPWLARYVHLLNTAADAIKAANPRMPVIGLGNVMPQNYRQLAMGVSSSVDGITDHPYSFRTPPEIVPHPGRESYVERVGFTVADADGSFASYVRQCREHSAKHDGPRQLWFTEFGYTTFREGDPERKSIYSGVSEEAQAKYILRRFMESLGLGIEMSILYNFADNHGRTGGEFEPERYFGLVRQDDSLKPAYAAVRRLAHATAGLKPRETVAVKVFPFSDRTEEHPRRWDGELLPALNRIMTYPFSDAAGRTVLALWSAERINDLNVRAADVEFDVDPARFTVSALDLYTGDTYSPAATAVAGRLMLPRLAVPAHPLLLTLTSVSP